MIISDATYVLIGTVLIAIGAIPSTLFTIYYGLVAPWWRSREGWNLFGFTLTVALLLDLSLLLRLTGQFTGIRVIALVIFAAIAGFMWQRLFLLLRAQRRGHDELQAPRTTTPPGGDHP